MKEWGFGCLGGREGSVGRLSGLRGHEAAAGEGGGAVELAAVHMAL